MTHTGNNGRLGNQIIRNLAVSLIAEKYDLYVNYHNNSIIQELGIELFSGSKTYPINQNLNDENYFIILNDTNLNYNLEPNHSYFQTNKITNIIYEYLQSEKVKTSIMEKNPFVHKYHNNNDLFIHIRLTDVAHYNPGIDYYLNTIEQIPFENLTISTDEADHDIIKRIMSVYPKATLIHYDEVKTLQFGSTHKYIILSHGSFSAILGYISFFSKVYYPEYQENKIWYGDMFSIKNWVKINLHICV
jgi:hypothetical protein